MNTVKPGWKTTEFWGHILTVIGLGCAAAAGAVTGPVAAGLAVASQLAYALSRGLTKGQPTPTIN